MRPFGILKHTKNDVCRAGWSFWVLWFQIDWFWNPWALSFAIRSMDFKPQF